MAAYFDPAGCPMCGQSHTLVGRIRDAHITKLESALRTASDILHAVFVPPRKLGPAAKRMASAMAEARRVLEAALKPQ